MAPRGHERMAGSLLEAPGEPLAQRIRVVRPTRIVWESSAGLFNAAGLLADGAVGPVEPGIQLPTILHVEQGSAGGVLLDFGRELNGSIEIGVTGSVVPEQALPQLRIRFGESASEAMSELGDRASGNDYAVRDQVVTLPWRGTKLIGRGGFRFVRLDAVDPSTPVPIRHVRALAAYSAQEPVGSFACSDPLLNRIWDVGAHTIQLNFQTHLWDGIKRDRLVWAGDIHPMVSGIQAVFGPNQVLPRSLDFIRDMSPSDRWMNNICGFSLWWIIVQERWYQYTGDRSYLEQQGDYLAMLVAKVADQVAEDGREHFDGGMRFIDWPSFGDDEALTEGLQALVVLAMAAAERMLHILGWPEAAGQAGQVRARAAARNQGSSHVKSVRALRVLAGLTPIEEAAALGDGGAKGLTAYLGYYVLEALGRAGDVTAALALIREFWGAMVERGATSFWEEFDLEWLEGSGRIDELTPEGVRDLHGDTGRFGHTGFRKSLCHGWSSGPTGFLTEHVLGIRPLAPGCTRLLVAPQLGDLDWASGRYPTPLGMVSVHHSRSADGSIVSQIEAPPGVEIVSEAPGMNYL